MIKLTIADKTYSVEFRHVTKLGKRAQLYPRSPVKAITTCVVAAEDFIAVDNAVCADEDNFARQEGRFRAMRKLLTHCGALKPFRNQIWMAYQRAAGFTDEEVRPFEGGTLPSNIPVRSATVKQVNVAAIAEKIASGAELRAKRQGLRGEQTT